MSTAVVLRAAVSACLGRYRGATRLQTESDLSVFLRWCADQNLDPLVAVRADIERYVRWLQDVRRYQPSTVSRRLSVVVGFLSSEECVVAGSRCGRNPARVSRAKDDPRRPRRR